jgi:hypothetical protein
MHTCIYIYYIYFIVTCVCLNRKKKQIRINDVAVLIKKALLDQAVCNIKEKKSRIQHKEKNNLLQYEYKTTTEFHHAILLLTKKLQYIKRKISQAHIQIQELKKNITKFIECQEIEEEENQKKHCSMYIVSDNICIDGDTIKHTGAFSNYGSAISGAILPNNQSSIFVLSVDSSPLYGGTCGIISSLNPPIPYHNDKTFFGWHYRPVVIKAGDLRYEDGWPGLRDGDEVILKYDPIDHTLQMLHCQLNRVFTIHGLPNIPFRRSVILYNPGSCMRIRDATENDVRTLKWE